MATLARPRTGWKGNKNGKPKVEPKIIHQAYFKSIGPRTYAAQVKELGNGNHLLVLTEGKRDDATNELRKTSLFIYAEDFPEFFKLLDASRQFINAHPVSPEAKAKRAKYWANNKPAVTPSVPRSASAASPGAATATVVVEDEEETEQLDA